MRKLFHQFVFSILIAFSGVTAIAQIPTVQYTPLAPFYYTHSTIYDTARVYSNGLIDQLCAIHYAIYKDDTLTPITSVGDYGSIEYTVRSSGSNYITQSITNGTGYLGVRPFFTTYNAFTLGIFDNYCVARNRPVMLEMAFDEPGFYKFYCEIQSCSNAGSSLGTSYTANGAPGCGTNTHSDYAATSCSNATPLYGESLYLTICEQGSISFLSGNTSYCPSEEILLVYTLGEFNDLADTTGLPSWLTPTVDVPGQTLTLTGTAPVYDPANPSYTFPVSAKISVNPAGCPGSVINQTITINNAPTPVITGTNSICEGSSTELLSDLKGTWLSSNGIIVAIEQSAPDSAVFVTGLSDGTVNVFCEIVSGECSVKSQPFSFTVNPVVKDTLAATICSNDSYSIGSIAYNTAGTYSDTLATSHGCDSIVTLNLAVNDTSFSEFWINDTSYTWNTITYITSGDYIHTFPNIAGCDSVVTLHLTITAGIENIDPIAEIYPNPANDFLLVQLNSLHGNCLIKVFSSEGSLVKSIIPIESKIRMDLSDFTPGLYFMNISNSEGLSATYRFSKQ